MTNIEQILLLESKLADLFWRISIKLNGTYKSVQLMRDDNFVHRKDRTSNDIHAFFELRNREYFHLRGYTRHMLEHPQLSAKKVFLTGYRKNDIELVGGIHSLEQKWYELNPSIIANQIREQNLNLFQKN